MSHFTQSADAGSATEKEPTTAKTNRSRFISTVSFLAERDCALNGKLCQDVTAMRIRRQGLRRGGAVWFQQGNFADAEEIVLECADVFLSLGIRRELVASLLLVRKAAESRHLSFTTLQKVIDLLHKEERSPRATPPEEP